MLRFEEAQARLLGLVKPLGAERAHLDAALGRVLAEDVLASADLPATDHSSMDGYALRSADRAGAPPYRLPVRGESQAGAKPGPLVPGSAMRIFTGATLPEGADAVVAQEDTARENDEVIVRVEVAPFSFVRRRGADLRAGGVALAAGTRLRPSHLGLAASVDRAWLAVARRPRVAIVCTGDELRAPGSPAREASLPESNGVALRAMARRAGADAEVLPYVADDAEATRRALDAALRGADVVVTVGGVSVGDRDFVKPALEAAGVTLDFWRVAIKPGKPLAVGRRGDSLVIGLPGNPSSAMVTAALFLLPALRALQGERVCFPPALLARLAAPFRHAPGRTEFARARLYDEGGERVVEALSNQASGAATSMAEADALLRIEAEASSLEAGARVLVYPAADLGF
ncbi:MAG: molybdopterin molybdotransferase MoeA [Polyangiaceae bacterium]|nr:molybdopterin molybdotransferase MoeA [Polyangiaceae bacterium]